MKATQVPNPSDESRQRSKVRGATDRPRLAAEPSDDTALELAIEASTSRILCVALVQGSLEEDPELAWEET